jgi:hypothetical protein
MTQVCKKHSLGRQIGEDKKAFLGEDDHERCLCCLAYICT